MIEKIIKKAIAVIHPPSDFQKISYSQDGEDLVLASLFADPPQDFKGFYVDIGAHHPFRFSNTYLFYQFGWRGINIDAAPGSMKPFNIYRKNDINIEMGVGMMENKLTFYCFKEPALNTFDEEFAQNYGTKNLVSRVLVDVQPLAKILDTHLPANTQIDFMSIDVEGLDLEVLSSNNWEKYRPRFILAEDLSSDNKLSGYLEGVGYRQIAKTRRTSIFKKES